MSIESRQYPAEMMNVSTMSFLGMKIDSVEKRHQLISIPRANRLELSRHEKEMPT
jgi:hypothetical protein